MESSLGGQTIQTTLEGSPFRMDILYIQQAGDCKALLPCQTAQGVITTQQIPRILQKPLHLSEFLSVTTLHADIPVRIEAYVDVGGWPRLHANEVCFRSLLKQK
jgi:hypothetical protein